MTAKEKLETVINRTGVEYRWLFIQSHYYVEEPQEAWIYLWELKKYHSHGEVPACVEILCDRLMADNFALFR